MAMSSYKYSVEPQPQVDGDLRDVAAKRICSLLGLCMSCGADVLEKEAHKIGCDAVDLEMRR